jgi:hypothetical protein
MLAALRYRTGQTVVLVLLAALVVGCASFVPLFTRSVEQGLLRGALDRLPVADAVLTVRAVRGVGDGVTDDDLRSALPRGVLPWVAEPVGSMTVGTQVVPRAGLQASPVRLVSRDGVCDHLAVTPGRCPAASGEVLVSAADARAWGWGPGTRLAAADRSTVPAGGRADQAREVALTVVGVYRVRPDAAYWLRTRLDGVSGAPVSNGSDLVPGVDALVTAPQTLASGWAELEAVLQAPLRRDRVTLDSLPRLAAAVDATGSGVRGASSDSPVPEVVEAVAAGRERARLVVPLLLAPVALLAVAALLLVASAAVADRRPELAVARLRGRSARSAGRRLVAGLGLTVALGAPLGLLTALAAGVLVREVVLPDGTPGEVPLAVPLAGAAAAVLTLLLMYAVARPVLAEPVAALLRGPSRRLDPRRWRPVDLVVVVLAAASVAAAAAGALSGPVALLVPVLGALGVGVAAARVLARAAARRGGRSVEGGSLAVGLAALALARRPGVRDTLAVVTAATALVVFASNTVVVAERNRSDRARLEVGAATVLTTDATSPTAFDEAVRGLPADLRRRAAAVAVVHPADGVSMPTLAVRPADLARVAYPPPGQPALALDRLALPGVQPVRLTGDRLTARLDWVFTDLPRAGQTVPFTPGDAVGLPPRQRSVADRPLRVGITVTLDDGSVLDRDLAALPLRPRGAVAVDAPILCPRGCRLHGIWLRLDEAEATVSGTVRLGGLALDGAPLQVADPGGWQDPVVDDPETTGRQEVSVSGDRLSLTFTNTGRRLTTTRADVPSRVPAVVAGPLPPGAVADRIDVTGLGGHTTPARVVQRVPALPHVAGLGALVDLDTLLRLGGTLPRSGVLQVWLDTDDPATVAAVRSHLASRGVDVPRSSTVAERQRSYDASATGWALLLGLVAAALALLLAVLVLLVVAVGGWRALARDLAGMRVVGVPDRVVRRAVALEHLAVPAVGVLLGTACAVVGSALVLRTVPLFDVPAAVPAPDLSPSWWTVGTVAVGVLLALGATGLATARWLGSRGDPRLLQEQG